MKTADCVAHLRAIDPKTLTYLGEVHLDLTGTWKRRTKVKGPEGVLRVFENEDEELTAVVQTDPADSEVTGTWFLLTDEMVCDLDAETLKDPAASWKPPTQASDFYFSPFEHEGRTWVIVTRKTYFDAEGHCYDQHEPLLEGLLADYNFACETEAAFMDRSNRTTAEVTDLMTKLGFDYNPNL